MTNKKPFIEISSPNGISCWEGWDAIGAELKKRTALLKQAKIIIAIECYPGTYADINLNSLKKELSPNVTCRSKDIFKDEKEIRQLVKKDLSKEKNTAKISTNVIEDYFDPSKLNALRKNIDFIDEGVILVHGIGAHKIYKPDIIVYSDISHWEILQRFRRNDISNLGVSNESDDIHFQYLWSYFIDWRICDRTKKQIIPICDYFMETNNWQKPKLATGNIIRQAMELATSQPIFNAPFYDPLLWEVQQSERAENDFKLCFNCNLDENNILIKIDKTLFEIPAINLVYYLPSKFMGEQVFRKFGSELPVRMDFIDNTEGKNNTLSVYPGPDFLLDNFGIHYQQNDNFYVLEANPKATIHLGVKEDISSDYLHEMLHAGKSKNIFTLLNKIPIQKHDAISLEPETIYSQGQKCIILHISTAPSIFRYNLLEQKGNKTAANRKSTGPLLGSSHVFRHTETHINDIAQTNNQEINEEILSKDYNHQIEIYRLFLSKKIHIENQQNIELFNLLEGKELVIRSKNDEFPPFIVHHAESFIIPSSIGPYSIEAMGNEQAVLLKVKIKV